MLRLNKTIAPIILFFSVVNLSAMKATQAVPKNKSSSITARLFLAIQSGDFQEVQEAIMADRDCVNARDALGNTPLIIATIKEDPFIVSLLIANQADPSLTTPYKQTALDLARRLYSFKAPMEEGSRKSYELLSSKEKKTETELKEMVRHLEDLSQIVSSLNNLDGIIQQLDNFPQNPDQPSA